MSQVNSKVLNDIHSSLVNSQVANEIGTPVDDGEASSLKRGRKHIEMYTTASVKEIRSDAVKVRVVLLEKAIKSRKDQ